MPDPPLVPLDYYVPRNPRLRGRIPLGILSICLALLSFFCGVVEARSAPLLSGPSYLLGFYAIMAGIGFLLATLLLASGIALIMDSPHARRMHLVYAWVKIPVSVLHGAAVGIVIAFDGPGNDISSMALPVFFYGAIGCIYPLVLISVMNRPGIKKYYTNLPSR